jgi:hypothetical protein
MSEPREEIIVFGEDDNLVGIQTRSSPASTASVALIFLNAGVLHRVGPHRLHVTLARRYAHRGVPGFRFDLGGIGDSRPMHVDLSVRDAAVADTRLAMDEITARTHHQRFVLFGLCSGADHAIATALVDDRVAGIIAIDPPAYPTRRALARKLATRVRTLNSPTAVVQWGAGAVARRLRAAVSSLVEPEAQGPPNASPPPANTELQQGRRIPTRDVFGGQLSTLIERGTQLHAIYSGSLDERYNHPDQLFEVYPQLRDRITATYCKNANHMFTELHAQQQLATAIDTWLDEHF